MLPRIIVISLFACLACSSNASKGPADANGDAGADSADGHTVSDGSPGDRLSEVWDLQEAGELLDATPEVDTPSTDAAEIDSGSDQTDTFEQQVVWQDCPHYMPDVAQCGYAQLPLDYSGAAAGELPIFFYRINGQAPVEQKKGQIWFLQGGPGGSGVNFVFLFEAWAQKHPEWDYYSLDHRGVGYSARLGCMQEMAFATMNFEQIEKCLNYVNSQYGEGGMLHFTTANAARDLAQLVEANQVPDLPVFVYGVSYGTYWAHKYLQLFPEQASGVVLDSLALPGLLHIDYYDYWFNENGRRIFQQCDEDESCSVQMDTIAETSWEAVATLRELLETGEICDEFKEEVNVTMLRNILAFMSADWFTRILMPAAVYRLQRCAPEDVLALSNFYSYLQNMSSEGPEEMAELYSIVLGEHIIQAELLEGLSVQEVLSIIEQAFVSPDTSYGPALILEWGKWPTYEDDGTFGKLADTGVPLLMLNGLLDPQTPIDTALPAAQHFTAENQHFVEVPWAPHGVVFTSYTKENLESEQGLRCGEEIMFNFLNQPEAPLDTSCLSNLAPLEFSADSAINQALSLELFGTDDMWDGTPFRRDPLSNFTLYGRMFRRSIKETMQRLKTRY